IYFNEEARTRVYEGFRRALRPGGILFVGSAERITSAAEAWFEPDRPFFYRKRRS
ncbi:chemotaxis protein CheR, partial [bacterium]